MDNGTLTHTGSMAKRDPLSYREHSKKAVGGQGTPLRRTTPPKACRVSQMQKKKKKWQSARRSLPLCTRVKLCPLQSIPPSTLWVSFKACPSNEHPIRFPIPYHLTPAEHRSFE
eukprot:1150497-Pelagomonas_calceolata.AAC.3